MRLLVVDLLAERKAFGKEGVREIITHFDDPEVFLWSPHTNERTDYGFGTSLPVKILITLEVSFPDILITATPEIPGPLDNA